jgi:hypothetical protein
MKSRFFPEPSFKKAVAGTKKRPTGSAGDKTGSAPVRSLSGGVPSKTKE